MSETVKRKVVYTTKVIPYTTEELIDFITDEFYTHLAVETKMYFMDKYSEQDVIRPRTRLEQRLQRVKDIKARIKDYEKRRNNETIESDKQIFTDGIAMLENKLKIEENYNIEYQKEIYEKTGDVYSTHTFTEFPLAKKINGLYDDFNALVLFYDNLTTEEIVSKLENAETLEEKRKIVKENIEITHIVLVKSDNSRVGIALTGKLDDVYSDVENDSAQILPPKFSDFTKLTLSDSESIKNNDLAQVVQERIDMDKEDLILEAALTIKGEKYEIFKSPHTDKEYIRYVCPSTQRVYYNVLNFNYLEESEYFKVGDPESYILAWYSISNLFIELTEEEISRPSIAC